MNLSIDIGNTRIKYGIFENEKLVKNHVLLPENSDLLVDVIRDNKISNCILSTVTENDPDLEQQIVDACENFILLSASTPLPFKNLYETPESLGKDRLSAAAGAISSFPGKNVLVIDAGTCIKYDLVTSRREFLGGAISPGIDMRYKALNTFTGKLPLIPMQELESRIGKTTRESIVIGVQRAALLEAEGFINLYSSEFPEIQIILTGGDGPFFEKGLKNSIFADPFLVLKGLNFILQHNVGQK